LDILQRQVREVIEDFRDGHPGGEIGENIINSDAHAADARATAPLARFAGDPRPP
jgi:hypothetical protein